MSVFLVVAVSACGSSHSGSAGTTTQGAGGNPDQIAKTIQSAITFQQAGCWSSGGANLDGAYAQSYFNPGAEQSDPDGTPDPNGTDCAGGSTGISVIDIQSFNSTKVAQEAAKSYGSEAVATYLDGPVVVFVNQQAPPDTQQAVSAAIRTIPGIRRG